MSLKGYLLNFINMVDSTMVKITSNFYRIKDKLIDIDQQTNFVQLNLRDIPLLFIR